MVRQDSAEAFTELYERHWKQLFATAYKRLRNTTAAEEVVQEAFIILWEKRASINPNSLAAYLSAIVKYGVFHQIARDQRRPTRLATGQAAEAANASDASDKKTLSALSDNRLEAILDARSLARLIERSAGELPDKCRLVFKYNKQLGYSLPEVARTLDISIKTAEAHLTKALKYIRLKLGNNFFFF